MRDAAGATSTSTITFTINGANDPPVGVADTANAVEDVTLSATAATGVLVNDTDTDAGDTKSVSAVAFGATTGVVGSGLAGTYGTLTLNADGSYSYLANKAAAEALGAGQTATEVFSYTMRDAAGATSTSTITFTINGANDPPVSVADTGNAVEDITLTTTAATGVLANDTDIDAGDTKTVSGVAFGATSGVVGSGLAGTYGTLTLNADGSYSYLANKGPAEALGVGQTATDVFSYTMRDSAGATSTANITFTISGANDAPTAVADAATATEDVVLNIAAATGVLANDTDTDTGDTKAVSGVAFGATAGVVGAGLAGTYGTLTLNADGSYSYLANKAAAEALGAGQTATETFSYTMRDTAGATSSSTITFTINGANDPPVGVADTANAVEDVTLTTTAATGVLANDTDIDSGDTKTVSAVAFGATAGVVGAGLGGTYGTLTLNADGSYTYLANKGPAEALAVGQTATEAFNYTVRDAAGATSTATLTFTISGANDAPTAVADAGTTSEDVALVIAASSLASNDTDPDGDTLTVTSVQGATNGTVSLSGGNVTFTPTANYNGPASFTYTVSDGNGGTSTATVNVTVTAVNDPPVNTLPASFTTNEDTVLKLAGLSASDVDAGAGTVTITLSVGSGTLAVAASGGVTVAGSGSASITLTGTLANINTYLGTVASQPVYTPVANATGAVTLTMTTSDGGNTGSGGVKVDTDTSTITITSINDAPSGTSATLTAIEDLPRTFSAADFGFTDPNDSPPNALSAVIVNTLPAVGSLLLGGVAVIAGQSISAASIGSLTYQAPADVGGNAVASFTFQVQDNGGTANGGVNTDPTPNTITLNVTPVADAPTLYAHATPQIKVAGATSYFTDNFNDNNFKDAQTWTPVRIHTNTFTPDPTSTKGATEASLFTTNDAGGQTGSDANFAAKWTVAGGILSYNNAGAGGSDDAQGILSYQSLSVASKALTSYVITADMDGKSATQQNNGIGIVFGYQNTSNFFTARWENMGTDYQPGGAQYNTYPGQANQLSIVQVVGGVATDLGIYSAAFTSPGMFTMRVAVDASGIDVYSSNVTGGNQSLVHYNYGSVAGGVASGPALNTIGLYTYDNDFGVSYDNVRVDSVAYKYLLDLQPYLNDRDGSESLSSVTLGGIPAGVTLADSVGNPITVTAGTATVTVTDSLDSVFTMSTTAQPVLNTAGITASVTSTDGASTSTTTVNVRPELTGYDSADTLNGTAAADWINGGKGNDTINGGAGNDVILGGPGNDALDGGAGVDVFKWVLADKGTAGTPATDTVANFGTTAGTDVLDLRDLLTGENHNNTVNLQNYLHFEKSGADTVVHISSSGGFGADPHLTGAPSAAVTAGEDQKIVLTGIDMVGVFTTDQQVILDLLTKGKLSVD
jgi:VCBS repeat-containing protein